VGGFCFGNKNTGGNSPADLKGKWGRKKEWWWGRQQVRGEKKWNKDRRQKNILESRPEGERVMLLGGDKAHKGGPKKKKKKKRQEISTTTGIGGGRNGHRGRRTFWLGPHMNEMGKPEAKKESKKLGSRTVHFGEGL